MNVLGFIINCCAFAVLWSAALVVHADEWAPSDLLLDGIRHIESADGRMLVGDQGRSLGPYQLSKPAWLDVDAWRKARGSDILKYATHVWSESLSRSYAADYLKILHARLEKHLKRSPTAGELYAAYNMGFAGFARCQFDLAKVNSVTAGKCRQIDAMTNGNLVLASYQTGR